MANVYRGLGTQVAKMPELQPSLDAAALKVLALVTAQAGQHAKTGDYVRGLKIENVRGKKGVRDRLVVATDPNSISIELGHLTRPLGEGVAGPRRWVPGLRIMGTALTRLPKADR
ncbi:DUF5403 family protein [Arthrobacter russicus]|uniref:DUF5403 family protein n=1 Tax=Arthrobacter russicus TaxID=172040 RepID=UPI0031DB41FD